MPAVNTLAAKIWGKLYLKVRQKQFEQFGPDAGREDSIETNKWLYDAIAESIGEASQEHFGTGGSGVSPSNTVETETSPGQSAAAGTSLLYSRGDHTHGTPAASSVTTTLTAAVNMSEGHLGSLNSDGEVVKSNAATSSGKENVRVIAPVGGVTAGNSASFGSVQGSLTKVRFGVAPPASANGDTVYLSETDGLATLTAPTSSGSLVIEIGMLQGADDSSNPVEVLIGIVPITVRA